MGKLILSATIVVMFLAVALQTTATKQCGEVWKEFGQACSKVLADRKTRSAEDTQESYGSLAWLKSPTDHLFCYKLAILLLAAFKIIYVILSSTLILMLLSCLIRRAYSTCPEAPVTPSPSDRTLAKLERMKRKKMAAGMQDASENGQKPQMCTHWFPGATGDDANGAFYVTHRKDIPCKYCNSKKTLAICKKLA